MVLLEAAFARVLAGPSGCQHRGGLHAESAGRPQVSKRHQTNTQLLSFAVGYGRDHVT